MQAKMTLFGCKSNNLTFPGGNKLVSIIIPFLNAERFLSDAVESVFAQTYKSWELFLVSDGSDDQSRNIALRYVKGFPNKVHYLEHDGQKNRGAAASRNAGVRYAQGEYIAFLDSDDVWLPQKLEQQVGLMELQPKAVMVYGPVLFWYSWTQNVVDLQKDFMVDFGRELNTLVEPPELLTFFYPLGVMQPPCLSDALLRKESVNNLGWFEETFVFPKGLCDDLTLFSKVHLKAPVFMSSECLTKYRQHPSSAVSTLIREQKFRGAESFFLNWLEEFLLKQKIEDSNIWKALEHALQRYRHPILYHSVRLRKKIEHETRWLLHKIWIIVARKRLVFRKSRGKIEAIPNPLFPELKERFPALRGTTTLFWESFRTDIVEVHVNAPNGPLFSRSDGSGSAVTGEWVNNGMTFYLQDVSGGKRLTISNTLDAVKVKVYNAKNRVQP